MISKVILSLAILGSFSAAQAVNPNGNHDSVGMGWACDADNYSYPLDIHFYQEGTLIIPEISPTVARLNRSDLVLAGVCGGTALHGFATAMPARLRDGARHMISAYAINIGAGTNFFIGNQAIPGVPSMHNFGTRTCFDKDSSSGLAPCSASASQSVVISGEVTRCLRSGGLCKTGKLVKVGGRCLMAVANKAWVVECSTLDSGYYQVFGVTTSSNGRTKISSPVFNNCVAAYAGALSLTPCSGASDTLSWVKAP